MTRGVRFGLIGAATLVFLLVAALGSLRFWASYRQRAAERQFAASFESMDALLARYPTTSDSPSLVKLAAILEPIGLKLLRDPSEAEVTKDAQERFFQIARFDESLRSRRDDGAPVSVPANLIAALAPMKAALDAAEAHINSSEPIVWKTDVTQGLMAPHPPLTSLRLLASAFLARSLQAAEAGRPESAAASLRALDRIVASLERRPEVISQLIVLAVSLQRNLVLLQIGNERIGGTGDPVARLDRVMPMLRSIAVETLVLPATIQRNRTDTSGWLPGSHPLRRLANSILAGPSLADYSFRAQRAISEMRSQDPCRVDLEAFSDRVESNLPWWNSFGRIETAGLVRVWSTSVTTSLDNELTRLVVTARAKIRAGAPGQTLETVPSGTCPSLAWTVEMLPEGDVLIGARSGRPVDPKILQRSSFRVVRKGKNGTK